VGIDGAKRFDIMLEKKERKMMKMNDVYKIVEKIFGDDAHRVRINMSGDCYRVEWEDEMFSVRVNEKNAEDKINDLYYDVACEKCASEFGWS
jgi:hypothetical protein